MSKKRSDATDSGRKQMGTPPKATVCLVTSCDAKFFDMARNLIRSLRRYAGSQSVPNLRLDKKFLNMDCTGEQLAWLHDSDFTVIDMDQGPAPTISGAPLHYRAQTCRPYLPDYFPGYDVYIWMDADTWVLSPTALPEYVQAALDRPSALVAVQEVDPAYRIFSDPGQARVYYSDNDQRIRRFYPPELAEGLKQLPRFNDGVFALHQSSPYWILWRTIMQDALNQGYEYFHDQDSLNVAVLLQKEVSLLPAQYNWLCAMAAMPVKNSRGHWCKPYAPREELQILHLIASGKLLSSGYTIGDLYRRTGLFFAD
ncbi:MAG TPA: hypothetical protein VN611_18440 [Patescibacteria group bacterium]|nr:hypothetical protein [Patescibacteria group bacterium]